MWRLLSHKKLNSVHSSSSCPDQSAIESRVPSFDELRAHTQSWFLKTFKAREERVMKPQTKIETSRVAAKTLPNISSSNHGWLRYKIPKAIGNWSYGIMGYRSALSWNGTENCISYPKIYTEYFIRILCLIVFAMHDRNNLECRAS